MWWILMSRRFRICVPKGDRGCLGRVMGAQVVTHLIKKWSANWSHLAPSTDFGWTKHGQKMYLKNEAPLKCTKRLPVNILVRLVWEFFGFFWPCRIHFRFFCANFCENFCDMWIFCIANFWAKFCAKKCMQKVVNIFPRFSPPGISPICALKKKHAILLTYLSANIYAKLCHTKEIISPKN